MPKNEKYRNDLIADEFKGLGPVRLSKRLEAIKKELVAVIKRQPENRPLIDFLLQRITIGADLCSKEFPQKAGEITVKDAAKLNLNAWFDFLITEPGQSRLKPVFQEFYMKSRLNLDNKHLSN